jgi:uncharacterized protein YegL
MFANPGFLALLALLPLVVWLHLRRRAIREVPSTWIWRSVSEGADPTPRVQRPPLTLALWLQLLAVLLTALALSEPRLGPTQPGKSVLVVLDAGIGMSVADTADGVSRLERAVGVLLEEIRHRPDHTWSIWLASDDTQPLAIQMNDRKDLAERLGRISSRDTATAWDRAKQTIQPWTFSASEIWVIASDPEEADGPMAALAEATAADLRWWSLAQPFDNLALEPLSVEYDQAARSWRISASVRAHGTIPRGGAAPEVVFAFQPKGATTAVEVAREPLLFSLGGVARVSLSVALPGEGLLSGRISTDDAAMADQERWVSLNPRPAQPLVALWTNSDSTGAVARALQAIEGLDVRQVRAGDPVESVDVLVVDGTADPFASGQLGQRPRAVLWLGSAPTVEDARLLPVLGSSAADWEPQHPLAAGTAWGSLRVNHSLSLPHPPGAEWIVRGLETPWVSVRARVNGLDVVVALDPQDETWTADIGFLTFVSDALRWLAPSTQRVTYCTTGVPCTALNPSGGLVRAAPSTSAEAETWGLPVGVDAYPSLAATLFRPASGGVWRVQQWTDELLVPVQLSSDASRAMERASTASAAANALPGWRTESRSRLLAWRWPLLVLALFLWLEGWIAGRGEERFWQWRHLKGRGILDSRRRRVLTLNLLALLLVVVAAVGGPGLERALRSAQVVVDAQPTAARLAYNPDVARFDLTLDSKAPQDVTTAARVALAAIPLEATSDIWMGARVTPTVGEPLELWNSAFDQGVRFFAVPAMGLTPGDVTLHRVSLSGAPRIGDTVELSGVIMARSASEALVEVLRDETLLASGTVALQPGGNSFRLPVGFADAGLHTLVARVSAADDPLPTNNQRTLKVLVERQPNVMVFSNETGRAERFVEALSIQGISARARPAFSLGMNPTDYAGIDAVALLNVAALDVTTLQQQELERFVREAGGGLVIAGGERSFGPGGYHLTLLDQLSPLAARVPREAPEVAMLFVLDRSGSMQQLVADRTRLDVAKEATLAAVELLGEKSQVAIVVFDEVANLLLPFTSSAERDAIQAALRPLIPGGGTAIYPGLELGLTVLQESDSATKHVIVLTDGLSQPADYREILASYRALGATVSAVAIGQGADIDVVTLLARLGEGTAHVTTDFAALPGILSQEAMMLAGEPIVLETTIPLRTRAELDAMVGTPSRFPALSAFVETSAKQAADTLLEDGQGRPLMASWRYGAGRVLAFGSHAVGPWSEGWAAVDRFPAWWGQWLRWVGQPALGTGLSASATFVGDEAWIRATSSAALTGVRVRAENADLDTVNGWLSRRGQGFEGSLPLAPGTWNITLSSEPSGATDDLRLVVVHDYLAALGAPTESLQRSLLWLSGVTGGSVAVGEMNPGSSRFGWRPTNGAWHPWLLLAFALWMVSLIIRYAPGWLEWRPFNTPPATEGLKASPG